VYGLLNARKQHFKRYILPSLQSTPVSWITTAVTALQWPFIVISAFVLGRYVTKLETRVLQAERNITALIERHLPHIHAALGEVKESLAAIQGALTGRRQ
jgi:hypothetical protein